MSSSRPYRSRTPTWAPSATGRLHVSVAEGPADARRFVRSALPRWTGPTEMQDAELLVSELVTNAIRHAGAHAVAIGVMSTPTTVQIGVHDRLDSPPVPAEVQGEAGGYGVHIVDHLADRWGVVSDSGGKTVWFELDADEDVSGDASEDPVGDVG